MPTIIECLVWFAISVVLMSFIEHQVHQHLMHRNFVSKFIRSLKKVFEHHAYLHHGQYYKVFSDDPLPPGDDRGIRLRIIEGFFEVLPGALIIAIISLKGAIIFEMVVCLHHLIWNHIHLEMHQPVRRFFSDWPIYKFLARHHYMHHKYPGKNFNVILPIADYVMGTHVSASKADLEAMCQTGLFGSISKFEKRTRPVCSNAGSTRSGCS